MAITLPYIPCYAEYDVDNNPYQNIYIDLTMRCNMDCNYCYNPKRSKDDMDVDHFEEVCKRLPVPVKMNFLGGEPAMHPRFFDFIRTARKYDHQVFFASNGYRYTNKKFMEKLQALDVTFSPGLSLDGGSSSEEFYEILNNKRCLSKKMKALDNLHKYGIGRVCLSAIITRGVNEVVIGELLELADRYSDVVRYIHFRSAAMVGRWANTQPYTAAELTELMRPYFTAEQLQPKCVAEIFCTPEEGGDCCYRFRPNPRLQISLIEFATEKSAHCPKRGKLLPDSFRIQPFFQNMMDVGDALSVDFGEVVVGAH